MDNERPSSPLDSLPLKSDQLAELSRFVDQLKSPSVATSGSSADAEAAKPGTDTQRSTTRVSTASGAQKTARLLIIASNPTMPEEIAEGVAQALGRELHPVGLSAVVSKFIAETEKHLEEIFDTAGETGAILFFDEADALFGKSSDAAKANFADQEVGYLLHHIESYNGISVIAVSAGTAIEPHLQERFSCVVRC
jgi:hypothetical protein